jgi:hypothetical protein
MARAFVCPVCSLSFISADDPDNGCCSQEHAEIYLAWSETTSLVPLSTFIKHWKAVFKPQPLPRIRLN